MSERLLNPVIEQSNTVHAVCKLIERIAIRKIEVSGTENLYVVREILREGSSVIIFPNHLSHADGPLLHKSMRENGFRDLAEKLRFIVGTMLMKKKAEWFLTHGYNGILMPAERDVEISDELRKRMVKNGLTEAEDLVTGGKLLTVFAEGGRSPTGKMEKVKPSVAIYSRLGLLNKTFILPVGILGNKIWPRNRRYPRVAKEGMVNYGQPFSVETLISELDRSGQLDDQKVMDFIMFKVAELLPEEYRGYYATSSLNS